MTDQHHSPASIPPGKKLVLTECNCLKNEVILRYLVLILLLYSLKALLHILSEPDSSVGIVNDYGLDGPGLNPSEEEIFGLSRPTLGPTEPPVKWVPCLSRG